MLCPIYVGLINIPSSISLSQKSHFGAQGFSGIALLCLPGVLRVGEKSLEAISTHREKFPEMSLQQVGSVISGQNRQAERA